MRTIGIIPARYNSERFQGKPLVMICGKTVIRRTYEQAVKALEEVYVATDDDRIMKEVARFGGIAFKTSADHICGTDRCIEAFNTLPGTEGVGFINIQGDQPFIDPENIKQVKGAMKDVTHSVVTLITDLDEKDRDNLNVVKAVINERGEVINFSRTYTEGFINFRHIGVYGFSTGCIQVIPRLPISANETRERLEQLRWLDEGIKIKYIYVKSRDVSIDTPGDLIEAETRHILQAEAAAIDNIPRNDYAAIIDEIYQHTRIVRGKVITSGMGKAGQVAQNIALTFSSTGTPAVFLHPGEAQHGDLGIIQQDDIFLLISNSGETRELMELVGLIREFNPHASFIVMTGNPTSNLCRLSSHCILTGSPAEVCPFGLTPTTSTTVMNAIGDILVVLMMKKIGFTKEDYALRHHGGYIGNKLKETNNEDK